MFRGKRDSKKKTYDRKPRRKYCFFCKEKIDYIDYKDINLLKRFLSDKGKIRPRRASGTCTQHQKKLAQAVKNAREMALLPYLTVGEATPTRRRSRSRW